MTIPARTAAGWDMRNSWPIVIGVIVVGLNALVFVQEFHAYRAAARGTGTFPIWTLLTLIAAAAYLLGAGILYDRSRRKP